MGECRATHPLARIVCLLRLFIILFLARWLRAYYWRGWGYSCLQRHARSVANPTSLENSYSAQKNPAKSSRSLPGFRRRCWHKASRIGPVMDRGRPPRLWGVWVPPKQRTFRRLADIVRLLQWATSAIVLARVLLLVHTLLAHTLLLAQHNISSRPFCWIASKAISKKPAN